MYDLEHYYAITRCYCLFHEIRDCYVHRGRMADERGTKAYKSYEEACDSPAALGEKELPEIYPIELHQLVHLSLRGVVGFSSILRKFIYTIDTELTQLSHTKFPSNPCTYLLWAVIQSASRLFTNFVLSTEMPASNFPNSVMRLLRASPSSMSLTSSHIS